MSYFGMLVLGMLVFLVVDIMRWNKGTPDITPMETARAYVRMNWLAVFGGLLIAVVLLILAINGEFQLFAPLNLPPVLSLTSAFLMGVGSTSLLKQWGGTMPEFRTVGKKIETPPK